MIKAQTFVETKLEDALENEDKHRIAYWSLAKKIAPNAKDEEDVENEIMDHIMDSVHDSIIHAVQQDIERLFDHHGLELPEDFFQNENEGEFLRNAAIDHPKLDMLFSRVAYRQLLNRKYY